MTDALDLRQLEAFGAVMASGSITAAAQLLGRSQPGVTRQIQELETALGFGLLDRSGRGVVPTERGRLFHVEVDRHLAGLQQLRDRAGAIRRGETPPLEIAAIPAFATGLLTQAIAALPGIEDTAINLRAVGGEEVVALLLSRISDLGLCSLPLRSPGFDIHWVAEVDCVAVLRADDPLAEHAVLPLRGLDGRRLITTANPYRQRRHVDEALRAAGLSRQVPLDTNTSFSALGAVRAGLGIALIEPLTPTGAPLEGLVMRPIDVALPFRYGAVTTTGRTLPPLLRDLIALMPGLLMGLVPGLRMCEPNGAETLATELEPAS
ncbi:LysR family transcriptional regulator [Humitalea sp. 24SJ18S-53]|uniref:LysR family transcriptional regulator n=1 Tax=Humitalea sp. 24SJ18S-53 TaxID=3422307 RepID=UPI003D67F993